MTEIQCRNCGATYETEYPLQGTITNLLECLICSRNEPMIINEDEKPKKYYKKVPKKYQKSTGPKKGSRNKNAVLKYDKKVLEFVRNNALSKPDNMLVKAINYRFGIDTTVNGLKWQMSQHNITRRELKKEILGGDEEDLKPPPPENDL